MHPSKPLRLWLGVALAILVVLLRYVVPLAAPPELLLFEMPLAVLGILGGLFGALAIAAWWLFFSRAPWFDRIGAIVLAIVATCATSRIVHESIAGGMMGGLLYLYCIPLLAVALVVWAVATRGYPDGTRRAWMVAAIVLACVPWVVLRTAGSLGAGSEFHWRWTPTPEQRLLAHGGDEPKPATPAPAATAATESSQPRESAAAAVSTIPPANTIAAASPAMATDLAPKADPPMAKAEWPGFRGPDRDSTVRGLRIETDWATSPPVQLWRRPIGPGWGSFAIQGDRFYTQEQRGEHEVVACHRVSTGEPVWRHRDAIRFYESNGGAGPRATPTLGHGRVYTLGATGIVNALNAATGAVIWSRNAAAETGVDVPDWGFSGSPLVMDDVVIIALSGQLVAYAAATGERRWQGPAGGAGYSSPHLAMIKSVAQVVLLRGSRTVSVAPADGTLLWEHVWQPGAGIVQPALTENGDVLLTTSESMGGVGIRRVSVERGSHGWTVQERWTSRGLKPYFNDFVVHEGHAYGFDGSILSSISLEDGTRKWKGGRYGNGQLVLLSDQDALLVLSEEGELALVSATPDQFREITKVKAIEGKTWNHPALVGDILLVRNGEEMAAFRLPRAVR